MKRNLILLAIIIAVGICLNCRRFQSSSETSVELVDPATVTDWIEIYDIDTEGYPYYPEGDSRHRQYSRRWYPPKHPAHDPKIMGEWSPLVKFDGDFKTLPKIRYSKAYPGVFQTISEKVVTAAPKSSDSASDEDYSTTTGKRNNQPSSKSITSYDSSVQSSTPYKSSNYPSTSSTPYKSSSSTSDAPSYKSPTIRRKP